MKNQLLPRKKMVLGRKTNFFRGTTRKTKKKHTMRPDSKKMVFLVFPRKKLVLDRKTNFFLGKDGFGMKNQLFPRKRWFGVENQLFPTNFFLGKRWFWAEKPTFS